MSRYFSFFVVLLLIVFHAIAVPDVSAIGVYLDLPSFFTISDSLKTQVTISQSFLQPDEGTVSVFEGELGFKARRKLFLRMGISYAAMQRSTSIIHGLGDAFIYMTYRVKGDTLDASGLFFRLDARLPFGSTEFRPFSDKSLDGGAGLEWRHGFQLIGLRLAATYNLVGERKKSDGEFINKNFLLLAAQIDFSLTRTTQFYVSGYTMQYREGGSREAYLITMDQVLSSTIGMQMHGGLEAGKEDDRTFNSLFSVAFVYYFPIRKKTTEESSPPDSSEPIEPGVGK